MKVTVKNSFQSEQPGTNQLEKSEEYIGHSEKVARKGITFGQNCSNKCTRIYRSTPSNDFGGAKLILFGLEFLISNSKFNE